MTKTIDTLVDDIYNLFNDNFEWKPDEENIKRFGERLAKHIAARASEIKSAPSLRLSNLGTPCDRKLWYTINKSEEGEPLPPEARIKFLFGDILEELLLFLAQEAGHEVTGQQDVVNINGIVGHRDAIIDGRLVDVKSASTFSFKKFKNNGLTEEGADPFGYITQINSYLAASQDDPLLKEKDVVSFLVIDKTLGNICLDTYTKSDIDYKNMAEEKVRMSLKSDPPARAYVPVPEGKSGNEKIPTPCSYCSFKHTCWPELRTFLYSNGPVYLTKVKKLPKVTEVDKDGYLISL